MAVARTRSRFQAAARLMLGTERFRVAAQAGSGSGGAAPEPSGRERVPGTPLGASSSPAVVIGLCRGAPTFRRAGSAGFLKTRAPRDASLGVGRGPGLFPSRAHYADNVTLKADFFPKGHVKRLFSFSFSEVTVFWSAPIKMMPRRFERFHCSAWKSLFSSSRPLPFHA